jgi:hypothetical protein
MAAAGDGDFADGWEDGAGDGKRGSASKIGMLDSFLRFEIASFCGQYATHTQPYAAPCKRRGNDLK